MNEQNFNERASRLEEVGKVIAKLPTEIRLEAFQLLKLYVSQQRDGASAGQETPARTANGSDEIDGDFFTKHMSDKPSDNTRAIAAYLFREYGSAAFSADDIKSIAARVGMTLPDRPDATLGAAADGGKKLFHRVSRGVFRPTVHGESYFRSAYGVQKGTRPRPDTDP